MTKPLVSIVVFMYNSSNFILKTLESAVNQSYENIELIITDDASTDSTVEICDNWLKANKSRFKSSKLVTTEHNSGLPGNCNRGWEAATGTWVKYIAGDDYLLPGCIEDYIDFVSRNADASVLFSKAEMIDKDGTSLENQEKYYKKDLQGWRGYFFNLPVSKQLKHFSREPIFLVTPSLFVKRNVLESINGFDENLRIFEDIPFVMRCLMKGRKVYSIPVKTVAYRIHDQAVSRSNDQEKMLRNLNELAQIYYSYRIQHLSLFNILDLGARFEAWLHYKYVLKYKMKGARFLAMLNIYRYYRRIIADRFEKKFKY